MLNFGRDICNNLQHAERREWLVTNGIGGYASGTIAGTLTRRYHGLLIASLNPPVERKLFLTKLDETVNYFDNSFPLYANRRNSGLVEPHGYSLIERFCLDGTTPVWTFSLADALLEKRVWMQYGSNTTYIQYQYCSGNNSIDLSIKALTNSRDHHANTSGEFANKISIEPIDNGICVSFSSDTPSLFLLSDNAKFECNKSWITGYFLSTEAFRGLDPIDDNFSPGKFTASLSPGESLTMIASTDQQVELDGKISYSKYKDREKWITGSTLKKSTNNNVNNVPEWIRQLHLSADQFIVTRPSELDSNGHTILAGYPWFTDWGRDTMISLPGLTISTNRIDTARSILSTYATYIDKGMLPNRFPDEGEQPEYNTVDATLWYFEAIRAYISKTDDIDFLCEIYPQLRDIIDWHQKGTRYNIHLDPLDNLLYAGENGVQLTWMDAKIGDWVVTPRIGKPIEINALWYNALMSMVYFASLLGEQTREYQLMAIKIKHSFSRYWIESKGYCYDVIDGPVGLDDSLRPNQIFAISLNSSPLGESKQRSVVDVCARELLTSSGLRSLNPDHPEYIGKFAGDRYQRDRAYHQGTVWAWLIGPFISAHYRVYKDLQAALSFLQPFENHLTDHCIGTISEIFDGNPPFSPHGCFAQAWSVAEVLRAYYEISN